MLDSYRHLYFLIFVNFTCNEKNEQTFIDITISRITYL